jgi:hypothetical protein
LKEPPRLLHQVALVEVEPVEVDEEDEVKVLRMRGRQSDDLQDEAGLQAQEGHFQADAQVDGS